MGIHICATHLTYRKELLRFHFATMAYRFGTIFGNFCQILWEGQVRVCMIAGRAC